jgi:localization factor PodJL
MDGVPYRRRPGQDHGDEDAIGDNLAAVNARLEELTRRFDRGVQAKPSTARPGADDAQPPDHVTEALARLDRRIEQIMAERRVAAVEPERPARPTALAPASAGALPGRIDWAAEIAARQRVLDRLPAAAPEATPKALAASQAYDTERLEHQLRQITAHIAALHRPYEEGLSALRSDLAEIGRKLAEAMPRQAIEALESQVRALADRVDRDRQSGADAAHFTAFERGLAELRDALRGLKPAESLVGFEDAVRALAKKIDRIGPSTPDPIAFKQLEQAIVSLRGVVANVASDGALAQLAAEVHQLARRVEQAAAGSSAEALHKLEARIGALMGNGHAVLPPELEASIRSLSERLDRIQLSQGDQLALGSLEDRIVRLSEKLDASNVRMGQLGAIERGMTDLLIHLEDIRGGARGPRTVDQPAPVHGPTQAIDPAPLVPITPSPPLAAAPARTPEQGPRPIDPQLPPDTPIEPGAGVPRLRPGTAAARIAASEAAPGEARPPAAATGGRSAAIAAARNAAKSSYLDTPVVDPKSIVPERSWISGWAQVQPTPAEPAARPQSGAPTSFKAKVFRQVKTLLIAASVVVIVVGAVQTAIDLLMTGGRPAAPAHDPGGRAPASPEEPQGRAMPAPDSLFPDDPEADTDTTGEIGETPSLLDPPGAADPPAPFAEVTGSIAPAETPPLAPASPPAAQNSPPSLPVSFGPTLQAAISAGNPAAEYEVGMRYAEGRGVAQSLPEAVRWFERSARAGFIPAQFHLAVVYEKGDGAKKDPQAARRLYLTAAGKGHAKSMHNLAVLHAEGIDGKPDYRIAARWFLKAASYGIADSQYNAGILLARGIGAKADLAESYKWFALAAAEGDREAAAKRDEVAARLDHETLVAARLAVQTFTPEREPDEITNLKVPPGGWDRTTAAVRPPAKPKRRSPASTAP